MNLDLVKDNNKLQEEIESRDDSIAHLHSELEETKTEIQKLTTNIEELVNKTFAQEIELTELRGRKIEIIDSKIDVEM